MVAEVLYGRLNWPWRSVLVARSSRNLHLNPGIKCPRRNQSRNFGRETSGHGTLGMKQSVRVCPLWIPSSSYHAAYVHVNICCAAAQKYNLCIVSTKSGAYAQRLLYHHASGCGAKLRGYTNRAQFSLQYIHVSCAISSIQFQWMFVIPIFAMKGSVIISLSNSPLIILMNWNNTKNGNKIVNVIKIVTVIYVDSLLTVHRWKLSTKHQLC